MWLCTKFGFYSIVQKEPGVFHVRGRLEKDLWNLVDAAGGEAGYLGHVEVLASDDTDYRYRIVVDAGIVAKIMATLAGAIDYSNFKDKIHELPDQKDKLGAYSRMWQMMYQLQE
jgi:hypothetical protein